MQWSAPEGQSSDFCPTLREKDSAKAAGGVVTSDFYNSAGNLKIIYGL